MNNFHVRDDSYDPPEDPDTFMLEYLDGKVEGNTQSATLDELVWLLVAQFGLLMPQATRIAQKWLDEGKDEN